MENIDNEKKIQKLFSSRRELNTTFKRQIIQKYKNKHLITTNSYTNIGDNMYDELVIVDAGHGGIDSGAVGNGLEEKDLTLKVAKYIYERLQEIGVPSVITRTEDEYLPKNARIDRIRNITNNNPNTLLVSNHINAGGGDGQSVTNIKYNN